MPSRNDKLEPASVANTSHLGQSVAKANSTRVLPASASHVDATTIQTLTRQTAVSSRIANANDALIDKRQQWLSSTRENAGITRDAPRLQSQCNDSIRRTGIKESSTGGHSVVNRRETGMQAPNHPRRGVPIAITEKPDPVRLNAGLVVALLCTASMDTMS